jgi:CRP-like cAMP-binding protein
VQLPALLREVEECYYSREQASLMIDPKQQSFDVEAFLASAGLGRRIAQLKAHEAFFSQGGEADSIFYLQKGRAKLTVVSAAGKEATLAFLTAGDFIGEESIAGAVGRRLATATAISACTALKIDRADLEGDRPRVGRTGATRLADSCRCYLVSALELSDWGYR